MQIIAITNQKGGTGKTTVAINLGVALASMRKKVLLIDLDPQANLTYSFGLAPAESIVEVLRGKPALPAILVNREGVDIAPASKDLADLEVTLTSKIGRESVLKKTLKGLSGYDYVFIDSPPSLTLLAVNALNAADQVLIPLQMEILSLQGLTLLLDTIREVRDVLNPNLKIRGIVACLSQSRSN